MIAVAEAARNITCSGGVPAAITNCLNFGNPYNPEVYYQFTNAIKGMGEACRKFNTPVTGGNVSFYNQTVLPEGTEPVYPTPTIGMLGILDDYKNQMTLDFKAEGDLIFMLGNAKNDISSSEYLRIEHDIHHSPTPHFELEEEFELQKSIQTLILKKLVASVHDISEGGLFVTLMESGMVGNLGFNINTDPAFRKDAYLFGEAQSRVVVSIKSENEVAFLQFLEEQNIANTKLGKVFGSKVTIDDKEFGEMNEWKNVYDNTLKNKLEE
jgi:phosphoribosylformylglycinamidine synthase